VATNQASTSWCLATSLPAMTMYPPSSALPCTEEVLGLRSEVVVGSDEGLPKQSAVRCDFLMLMFKTRLTGFVATLPAGKRNELRRALMSALQLDS
jgi:mRNA-degrading endonuclease toxin of MazEF toxin-antitoxin module